MSNKVSNDLTGKQFGNWKVLRYDKNNHWICECQCENHTIKSIQGYSLTHGKSKSCGCLRKKILSESKVEDLTGKRFGDWLVIEYKGNSMWFCECQCELHTRRLVKAQSLKSGKSKSCGHDTTKFKDLSGTKINHWNIEEYLGDGMYRCICDCANHTEKIVSRSNLVSGASKSCGCGHKSNNIIDLQGKRFGSLEVLDYIGDSFWRCKCVKCGNISVHNGQHLRRNKNFKCEVCELNIQSKDTVINKLKQFIEENNRKPYRAEAAETIGVGVTTLNRYYEKFGLSEYIDSKYRSKAELEIRQLFPNAIYNDRKILGNGQELDIYIPDKQVAIEFNGGYWHSDEFKDKKYHQNKTLLATEKGIHLIHIFEYDWINEEKKNKIIRYLREIVYNEYETIYARNTEIRQISNSKAKEFEEGYHLQGSVNSDINIGLYFENELLAVMSFSNSRFDINYQYEITRLTYKFGVKVIGGTEKLFKYFVNKYKPYNIVSYCDIAIFTGNIYKKLGMKEIQVTEPGYVWWNLKTNEETSKVYSRYQTTKQKLIDSGFDSLGSTENEIMSNLGFYKIYNCGNKKFAIDF